MPCPRCDVPLDERKFGRTTLHACRPCGGVWLDTAQARAVTTRSQGILPLVVASEKVARSASGGAAEPRPLRCPLDAELLRHVHVDGVEVDVCRVHGTWFDAGEVRRIANAHTEQLTASSAPETPKKPSSDSDPITAFIDAVSATLDEI